MSNIRVEEYHPHIAQFTQSPNYMRQADGVTPLVNGRIDRIVLHATVGPCSVGQAEAIAKNVFGVRNTAQTFHGSSHLIADPGIVGQCLDFNKVAEAAPPNENSWHIELCDNQDESNPNRWGDTPHIDMLRRAARRVADLCLFGNVPIRYITAPNLDKERGITTHAQVSLQFHQTDHTDPGPNFPMTMFLRLVGENAYRISTSSRGK